MNHPPSEGPGLALLPPNSSGSSWGLPVRQDMDPAVFCLSAGRRGRADGQGVLQCVVLGLEAETERGVKAEAERGV